MTVTTSGADVSVVKSLGRFAPDEAMRRLQLQWEWLRDHSECPGIVRVGCLTRTYERVSYTMEVLEPSSAFTAMSRVEWIVGMILPRDVWSRPARRRDWVPNGYIARWHELIEWWKEIGDPHPDEWCDTHGDPTFENLMMRPSPIYCPVLIDPLPDAIDDGKVPSVRALDMGKVLQSLIGYELVKTGMSGAPRLFRSDAIDLLRDHAGRRIEWRRTCWACALHVRRFIPYQDPQRRLVWEAYYPEVLAFLRKIASE